MELLLDLCTHILRNIVYLRCINDEYIICPIFSEILWLNIFFYFFYYKDFINIVCKVTFRTIHTTAFLLSGFLQCSIFIFLFYYKDFINFFLWRNVSVDTFFGLSSVWTSSVKYFHFLLLLYRLHLYFSLA